MYMKKSLIFCSVLVTSWALATDFPAEEDRVLLTNGAVDRPYESPAAKSFTKHSPNGVAETCMIMMKMPGGRYYGRNKEWSIRGDQLKEENFCEIDFYNGDYAICPKTWSTSPGTIVWDISKTGYQGNPQVFENEFCGKGKRIDDLVPGAKKVAKYKQTMNQSGTSGTFSNASLLYYHFSRYFHSSVYVPVAVYRSMDKEEHLERVTNRAMRSGLKGMIGKGWQHLHRAENNPSSYKPTDELFTPDRDQIYGIFIRGKGTRYSEAVNGTRASGWGLGQNKDYMQTAPFTALRKEGSLDAAVREGIAEAFRNRKVAARTTMRTPFPAVSGLQMVYWMKELSEIAILDFIFSQQDRVGNIDFRWYWYWVDEENRVRWAKAEEKNIRARVKDSPKPEGVPGDAILIQRTQLNDNDAGGRYAYANFAKKAKHLQSLRHMGATTYSKLVRLNNSFKAQGSLFRYVEENMRLSQRQRHQIYRNTELAVNILKQTCQQGKLGFDLNPEETFISGGQFKNLNVDCETGEIAGKDSFDGGLNITDAQERFIEVNPL